MRVGKKTYGFDFISLIPGQGNLANPTACYLNCLKAEYSQFAKTCRKKGGVFKCCQLGYTYLSSCQCIVVHDQSHTNNFITNCTKLCSYLLLAISIPLSIVKPVLHNTLSVSIIKSPGFTFSHLSQRYIDYNNKVSLRTGFIFI